MSFEEGRSSWHPAFMPHTTADLLSSERKHASSPVHKLAQTRNSDIAPELGSSQESHLRKDATEDHLQDGPSTPERKENDDHPELGSLRNALTTSLASPGGVEMDENPLHNLQPVTTKDVVETAEETSLAKGDFPSKGPANESGHMSSASFARTVPRDMDWGEDDEVDTEWNISRTDTDPFKTMASSDRTNSFPQVPPSNVSESFATAHTIPLGETNESENENQVSKDLFGDDDTHGDEFFAKAVDPGSALTETGEQEWFNNHGGNAPEDDYERAFGGDVQDEPDFEARYEEGMPLMPDAETEQTGSSYPQDGNVDLFSNDELSHEDDCFSGIGGNSSEIPAAPHHQSQPSLERKSTMHIMNSMHYESPEQVDSPTELFPAETRDMESSHSSLDKVTGGGIAGSRSTVLSEVLSEVGNENDITLDTHEPSEEDLAAKWKAALDGDEFLDDEELLDDEPDLQNTELDPAALFGSDDEGFLEDDDPTSDALEPQLSPSIPAPVTGINGHITGFDNTGGAQTTARPSSSSRYLPPNAIQSQLSSQQPSNPYKPVAPLIGDFSRQNNQPGTPTYGQQFGGAVATPPMSPFGVSAQAPRPEMPKSQSFADKSKGGYSSPYDLPMEVVKPRKRASMQQMSRGYTNTAPQQVAAPPRSSSMNTPAAPLPEFQGPLPSRGSNTSTSPILSTQNLHQSPHQPPHAPVSEHVAPTLKSKASFFEELPISSKPRHPGRYTPQPTSPAIDPRTQQNHTTQYPPSGPVSAPPHAQNPYEQQPPVQQSLVAPPKASPYANLHNGPPKPIVPTSRYSPAPVQPVSQMTPPPPPAQGRYATAPPPQRQPNPLPTGPPVTIPAPPSAPFAHQPRTSSPLAHFERSQDQRSYNGPGPVTGSIATLRRGSSGFDHLTRTPSLPITQEVDEQTPNDQSYYGSTYPTERAQQQHSSYQHPGMPPIAQHAQEYQHAGSLSPSKRSVSGYLPEQRYGSMSQEPAFIPPQRSQTQSPGRVMAGPRADMSIAEPYQRPLSVHGPASPKQTSQGYPPMATSVTQDGPRTRTRGFSQAFNYVAPTDGREHDPLQRWRGCPVFAWGVGGTLATSFPKEVPRYGMGQTQPQIMVSPGEIKIRNLKELYPLSERLVSFPGPLKNKGKKKEVLAWLSAGIDMLDRDNEYLRSLSNLSHEDKRQEERAILWKILKVMIENDGILEGTDAVNKAVRAVLSPELDSDINGSLPQYTTGAEMSGIFKPAGSNPQADPVDPAAVDELRKHLLRGEREKAVWEAVDKRLWAHAMLISNTVSKDLYKQVAQEFVQKEVKSIGENTESLAALYEIFAGNFEESVDELVPPSARAGFQMVSTSGSGPSKSSLDGLDRWRETLGLVLSNRSENDNQAINALGKLLSGYGRAEAAHICFLFGRAQSIFGGIDDSLSNIVLVGSDHLRQPFEFDKELEPILLSEVYEFALTLSNTSNMALSMPHLSVYKLQHAMILAQQGQRDKALQYCEAIASSITSQTRRSPYHHSLLVAALDDLSKRLKQSPKDESSSWISKPSIDKVSTSVWSKFNKFVAGDENDAAGVPGSEAGSDIGPFARIAGGTPTISRSPSNADLYGAYSGGSVINGSVPPPLGTRTASRYTPGGAYTPPGSAQEHLASSYGSPPQHSSFGGRRSFEDRRSLDDARPSIREVSAGSYQGGPLSAGRLSYGSTPAYNPYAPSDQTSYTPSQPVTPIFEASQAPRLHESPPSLRNSEGLQHSSGYDSSDSYNPNHAPSHGIPTGGYEPSSNAYEPPSNDGYEPPSSSGYEPPSSNGYEPPSSSGYEPPAYEPAIMGDESESPVDTRPKKKSFMDDDDDYIPPAQSQEQPHEKSKAEKDREAEEAFKRAAEADAQKDIPAAAPKKGWGLGGWFGGKKESISEPNKPIKAKLGEESSFVYDPELKRWVNKKAGKEGFPERSAATPPPPKGPPRTASGPPGMAPTSAPRPNMPPSAGSAPQPQQRAVSAFAGSSPLAQSDGFKDSLAVPPPMSRTVSSGSAGPPTAPPSRPSTGMSNASSIDDLLGPPQARKGGAKKAKKGRGYIDVMGDKK